MAVRLSTSARDASTDAISALADAGSGPGLLRIYTGAQPATPNTAASGTLLAEVELGDPAFGASSAGTATGADPDSVVGLANGTAGWWRIVDSTGAAVMDGSVSDGSLVLSSSTIATGVPFDITALSHTTPVG